MTQDAIVFRCLPDDMAEVVVTRATACGGNCGSCEACMFQSELKTMARNLIRARPGQRVVIESKSSTVYGAILLVYVLPIVLALLGYFAAFAAGAPEGLCIVCCFAGVALGAGITVVSQRLKKNQNSITFDIVQLNEKREVV
ncbi:MAG: SoxR reducing system RseC family protein [Clostridia bacterium]|nr:SoxR reducing system RseC family protein [Oscillospiraceae bacterium]MBO5570406.1 SoxR reducing system RseC family protein [Clostridia bacterium]